MQGVSPQIPEPLRRLIELSSDQSPEVQRRVQKLVLIDHRMKRTVAELAVGTRQVVEAIMLTGTCDDSGQDVGVAKLEAAGAAMQERAQPAEAPRRGTLEGVTDPVDPKNSPTSEDRRRAIQEHAWLTRDGQVLADRDSALGWLVDRGALPEMYRPPNES